MRPASAPLQKRFWPRFAHKPGSRQLGVALLSVWLLMPGCPHIRGLGAPLRVLDDIDSTTSPSLSALYSFGFDGVVVAENVWNS